MLGFILLTAVAFSGDIGLGFDYTNQRYVAIEEDTVRQELFGNDTSELETEARVFWNAAAEGRGLGFDNSLSIGSSALADQLRLDLTLAPASWLELTLADDADARIYHRLLPGLADTSWQRSTIGNTGRLGLALRPGAGLTLRADDELEYGHYLDPDSLNQDHLANRLDLDAELALGDLSSFGLGYTHRRRWSDLLGYSEHAAGFDIDYYFDPGPHCLTSVELGRRTRAGTTPAYWELAAEAEFDIDLSDNVALELGDELLAVRYDSTSLVYTNTIENRLQLEAEMRPGADFAWHAGAELGTSRSLSGSTEDDFRETALILGLDFTRTDRFWLTAENRLGRRRYLADSTVLASNYLFTDLSLLLDWTIVRTGPGALELVATADLAPEWHTEPADNITTALLAVELKWRY